MQKWGLLQNELVKSTYSPRSFASSIDHWQSPMQGTSSFNSSLSVRGVLSASPRWSLSRPLDLFSVLENRLTDLTHSLQFTYKSEILAFLLFILPSFSIYALNTLLFLSKLFLRGNRNPILIKNKVKVIDSEKRLGVLY